MSSAKYSQIKKNIKKNMEGLDKIFKYANLCDVMKLDEYEKNCVF